MANLCVHHRHLCSRTVLQVDPEAAKRARHRYHCFDQCAASPSIVGGGHCVSVSKTRLLTWTGYLEDCSAPRSTRFCMLCHHI